VVEIFGLMSKHRDTENTEVAQRRFEYVTSSFAPSVARPRGLPRFTEFVRDTQQIGQSVVVGAAGWGQKLEQNKQAFAAAWVVRPEFLTAHPETQTVDQYVDSLFLNSGAAPTTQERSNAITAFGSVQHLIKSLRATLVSSVSRWLILFPSEVIEVQPSPPQSHKEH